MKAYEQYFPVELFCFSIYPSWIMGPFYKLSTLMLSEGKMNWEMEFIAWPKGLVLREEKYPTFTGFYSLCYQVFKIRY